MSTPVIWFDQIDSTNEEARRRAEADTTAPVWLAARQQTAGRGRLGRVWQGHPDNLAATYLGVFDLPPAQLATASFVMALAVADVCDSVGVMPPAQLKWPNDVYVVGAGGGAKVAGILLESGRNARGQTWLAMGVGINLVAHPTGLDYPATALAHHGAMPPPTPDQALALLDHHLHRWLAVWHATGFAPIRDAWMRRAYGLMRPAVARLHDGDIHGVAMGLDDSGALELKRESGQIVRISAGEVLFG